MRLILTHISIFITLVCLSQTIPNGDFESWETRDHYKLEGWYSPTRNVERTSDAKVGKYALKLVNTYSATSNGSTGYVTSIDYNNKQELNGFAISGEPLSLVFWSKHDLALGDTARAYVVFREKGTYRGKVDFRFSGTTNGQFVKYSVPIEWNGIHTSDTAWINLYSYIKNKVSGDGFVIFDDFHFENIGKRTGDIVNHDFEDWDNIGVDYPSIWRSIDLLVYENYTSFLADQSIYQIKGKDAFRGGTSLLIKNYDNYGSPRSGYCYIGTENNDYYTPSFPFTDTFKYLQGYYKYLPAGDDTARINFRAWQAGSSRSYNNFYFHEPVSEWTFFSMPIVYDPSRYQPDSAALIIWSTSTDSIHGFNSSIYLDNLELVMEPTPLKLSVQENTLAYSVFPNPTKDFLYLDLLYKKKPENFNCWATNTLGQSSKLTTEDNFNSKRIDVSSLSPSVYFLTIQEGNTFSKPIKFIKQ